MDRTARFARFRPRRRLAAAVATGLVLSALLAPRPAAALEKVINGTFDYGLSNWPQIIPGADVSWDGTLDADGSALSGSYRVENQSPAVPNSTVSVVVARCYPANPGDAFFGGGTVRFAENEPSKGSALVLLKTFATADCSGPLLAGTVSDELQAGYGSPGRGVWTKLPAPPLVVPPNGKSIILQFFVGISGGTNITANIDDVYLAPVGTPVCGGLPATMVGTEDPDVLSGTEQSDVIVGLGGADQIDGKGGNDRICGGAGKDTIHGGPGDDDLYGNGGGDTLYGDAGDDVLTGGPGKDTLNGGADEDVVNGGGGFDTCNGGLGFDVEKKCESVALVP